MRPSGRRPDQLRDIRITRNYTKHAEGSVLIEFGETDQIFLRPRRKETEDYITGRFG